MARRIIDLSVPLQEGIHSDPEPFLPRIERILHPEGAAQLAQLFPGLRPDDLRDGEGWAVEFVHMSTHAGTHMEAPFHYRSRQDDGARGLTIDEFPLECCIGPGVKLAFRHVPAGHVITPAQIDTELARIGYTLRPGDIVLVNTAAGERYGESDFLDRGCGMGREATLHPRRQGIHLVGTDAGVWDAPFWEGHFAGSTIPYCQSEKVANWALLPPHGFEAISLPVRVWGGSAGWTRSIAVLND